MAVVYSSLQECAGFARGVVSFGAFTFNGTACEFMDDIGVLFATSKADKAVYVNGEDLDLMGDLKLLRIP